MPRCKTWRRELVQALPVRSEGKALKLRQVYDWVIRPLESSLLVQNQIEDPGVCFGWCHCEVCQWQRSV